MHPVAGEVRYRSTVHVVFTGVGMGFVESVRMFDSSSVYIVRNRGKEWVCVGQNQRYNLQWQSKYWPLVYL